MWELLGQHRTESILNKPEKVSLFSLFIFFYWLFVMCWTMRNTSVETCGHTAKLKNMTMIKLFALYCGSAIFYLIRWIIRDKFWQACWCDIMWELLGQQRTESILNKPQGSKEIHKMSTARQTHCILVRCNMSIRLCLVSWERASLEGITHHLRGRPLGLLVFSFEPFKIPQLKYENKGP